MRGTILIASLILLEAVAAAGYPGPDSMGVYADVEASGTVATGCELAPGETVRLYLCITHPSGLQVMSWEAHVEIVSEVTCSGVWTLMNGINIGTGDDYIVGTCPASLLPNEHGVVVLMWIDLSVDSSEAPVEIHVRGVEDSLFDGLPGYAAEVGVIVATVTSTGGDGIPVFVVNGEAPVANSPSSWGGVRRLYE